MAGTRVDFYVVEGGRGPEFVACRLAGKALEQGLSVLIAAGDDDRLRQLDDLLWTFSGQSFLPHVTVSAADADRAVEAPIRLATGAGEFSAALLINLSAEPAPEPARFERIAEVVGPSDDERRSGRERFRYYRDERQLAPETHRIGQ